MMIYATETRYGIITDLVVTDSSTLSLILISLSQRQNKTINKLQVVNFTET